MTILRPGSIVRLSTLRPAFHASPATRAFSIVSALRASEEPAVAQGQQNKPKPSEIKGAQPKILNVNPPSKEEESEDVRKHNEDMERRAEKAHAKVSNEDAYKDKTGGK